jgi:hypothetical protein
MQDDTTASIAASSELPASALAIARRRVMVRQPTG